MVPALATIQAKAAMATIIKNVRIELNFINFLRQKTCETALKGLTNSYQDVPNTITASTGSKAQM
jgi:hypothetical protein